MMICFRTEDKHTTPTGNNFVNTNDGDEKYNFFFDENQNSIMKHIKDIYKEAFEKHGNSPASVLWPKGRQDDRFNALTREINQSNRSRLL
jgi:hypothetical protein